MGRILVVDDSHTMRAFVRAAIEEGGLGEIDEAETGFQAIRLISQSSYELAIVDVNMPGLNGLELLAYFKRQGARSPIVIMISTEAAERDQRKALDLGARAFLSKPFSADALCSLAREVLREAQDSPA